MKQDGNSGHIFPTNVKSQELQKIATIQKIAESEHVLLLQHH